VVELLLDRGADVAVTDDYGQTALAHVVKDGHEDVAVLLEKRSSMTENTSVEDDHQLSQI
jgi:ankyrin repeat protein